jgi:energy-coupling factor transporter transmembrane protein EcfT
VDTKTLVFFILGLVFLPIAVAFILIWTTPARDHSDLLFNFACFGAMLGWVTLFIVWTRRGYGRKCQQFRARSWGQIAGRFDDGEIVTMRKGRSKIAGFQVWLGYEYQADGEQAGLYTLPFVGEFPSEEVAESYRKRAANREIVVRVAPRKPKRSCVLDEDVRLLIGD